MEMAEQPVPPSLLHQEQEETSAQPRLSDSTLVKVQEIFEEFVVPDNVLSFFHKYDINVLTKRDIDRVKAITNNKGDIEGASTLFCRLIKYNNWWPCLVKVLCDKTVKLKHAADLMKREIEVQENAQIERPLQTPAPQDRIVEPPPSASQSVTRVLEEVELTEIQPPARDRALLLVGKSGHGKSATGNSIVGRRCFKSKRSTEAVTTDVKGCSGNHGRRNVVVVDTPGVGNTSLVTKESVDSAVQNIAKAIAETLEGFEGFDAILLVLRCGERFTQEERDTLTLLRAILGEDFLKKYCILVLTHVDNFERDRADEDQSDENLSIEDWLRSQEGDFKELLNEVENRMVLFDNRTTDELQKRAQVDKLMTIVDNLPESRYSIRSFSEAKRVREGLSDKAKEASFCRNVVKQMKAIIQKYDELFKRDPLNEQLDHFKLLRFQISELCNKIDLRQNLHSHKKKYFLRLKELATDLKNALDNLDSLIQDVNNVRNRLREDTKQTIRSEDAEGTRFTKKLVEQEQKISDIKLKHQKIKYKTDKYFWQIIWNFILFIFKTMNNSMDPNYVYDKLGKKVKSMWSSNP